jgi:hypothetical protein
LSIELNKRIACRYFSIQGDGSNADGNDSNNIVVCYYNVTVTF